MAPHAEPAAYAAAAVADMVVIPTRPATFDLQAIGETVRIVESLEAKAAIVINAAPPRSTVTEEARKALKLYGLPICPTAVVQRIALSHAVIDGRGVQEFDPRGKASAEISATWKWIKRRL